MKIVAVGKGSQSGEMMVQATTKDGKTVKYVCDNEAVFNKLKAAGVDGEFGVSQEKGQWGGERGHIVDCTIYEPRKDGEFKGGFKKGFNKGGYKNDNGSEKPTCAKAASEIVAAMINKGIVATTKDVLDAYKAVYKTAEDAMGLAKPAKPAEDKIVSDPMPAKAAPAAQTRPAPVDDPVIPE